jgi:hypothetical protein
MWLDRSDANKVTGKLATKLGHATSVDCRNAMHVLRYLKGVPRIIEGSRFELAPAGAVHVQTDADWGGAEVRKSTSGVTVWVRADDGQWYFIQSVSKKETTVAVSRAESELIAMLAGVCETRGIKQLWKWMLAKRIIDDLKDAEDIIGSDSSAGISILKSRGLSRRTKHVELKVFFLQAFHQLDYVKIRKCKSEDILSDRPTIVMTMPKHHMHRCGLRDIQITMVTATTEMRCEHPPPVRCSCMTGGRHCRDVSITWTDPPRCSDCLYTADADLGCDCSKGMRNETGSHAKVMTLPKHHVQRGGLKDIQIMMVTAIAMQC